MNKEIERLAKTMEIRRVSKCLRERGAPGFANDLEELLDAIASEPDYKEVKVWRCDKRTICGRNGVFTEAKRKECQEAAHCHQVTLFEPVEPKIASLKWKCTDKIDCPGDDCSREEMIERHCERIERVKPEDFYKVEPVEPDIPDNENYKKRYYWQCDEGKTCDIKAHRLCAFLPEARKDHDCHRYWDMPCSCEPVEETAELEEIELDHTGASPSTL